jgi:hypothetical protein
VLLDYINNIENLKSLARVSILGFQSDMEDIRGAHTEQELSKIGLGWTERAIQPKLTAISPPSLAIGIMWH